MCPVTRFFAVETNLSFWWDLESVDKKLWPVAPFWQYRLSQVFDGTWKNFDKKVRPVTHFFRSADYLKFLMGFRKISTKMCAQLHVFSLWRLTWVFGGTWKNFYKKVCPVTRFFAVETILSFWWDLESVDKKLWQVAPFWQYRLSQVSDGTWKNFHNKLCPVTRFFAVETILSFWRDLESFDKKVRPVTHFFRSAD